MFAKELLPKESLISKSASSTSAKLEEAMSQATPVPLAATKAVNAKASGSYLSIFTSLSHYLPSSVTGYVDDAPRLIGHPIFGAASQPSKADWISDIITACDKEIKADPRGLGLCRFYIGPMPAAYISSPLFLQKIYYAKRRSEDIGKLAVPKNGDTSGVYQFLFGDSILTFEHTDPRWAKARAFMAGGLLAPQRLKRQADTLKTIAKEAVSSLAEGRVSNVEELRSFGNHLILDMVCQAQLSLFDVTPSEKVQLISIVASALPEMSKLSSTIKLKLERTFYWRPRMLLDDIKAKGEALIERLLHRNRSHILTLHEDPNEDSLLTKYIFENALSKAEEEFNQKIQDDLLTKEDRLIQAKLLELNRLLEAEKIQSYEYDRRKLHILGIDFKTIKLNTAEIRKFTALVLFAGYETTSTFLFFNLLVLADPKHKHIIHQVRETKDQTALFKLLDQVIRETGRLYPSFPIMKDTLNEDVILDGITLKKGTLIFLSPLRMQSDPKIFVDPKQFILGRKLDELSESSHFILFGQKPRTCPGRHLAFLEIKTILAELVPAFDMELDSQLTHPFPVAERFGLMLADSIDTKKVAVKVTPTSSVTPSLRC